MDEEIIQIEEEIKANMEAQAYVVVYIHFARFTIQ